MRYLLISLTALALFGCDEILNQISDYDGDQTAPDFGTTPTAQLGGSWTVTGDGSLTECDDPLYNIGGYTLSSLVLDVEQAGDGSLQVTNRNDQNGFAFSEAQVRERFVQFTITEGSGGQQVVLAFAGEVDDRENIRGTFSGEGPVGCTNQGNFSVEIVRPAAPDAAAPDATASDAGIQPDTGSATDATSNRDGATTSDSAATDAGDVTGDAQ